MSRIRILRLDIAGGVSTHLQASYGPQVPRDLVLAVWAGIWSRGSRVLALREPRGKIRSGAASTGHHGRARRPGEAGMILPSERKGRTCPDAVLPAPRSPCHEAPRRWPLLPPGFLGVGHEQ